MHLLLTILFKLIILTLGECFVLLIWEYLSCWFNENNHYILAILSTILTIIIFYVYFFIIIML